MIQQLLLVAHVFIALGIILFVLLQRGKGAEAGAAFGSGASGTVFGARGSASFLTRTTAFLAAAFFGTSLALAFFANQPREGRSVITGGAAQEEAVVVPADEADMGETAGDDLPALPEEDAPPPEEN